ncbi:MAG: hypothetical protein BGO67_01040 [Alphaproteobacteria bacterium 41-28]|nr:MAG: hypothetical protein BGO67_01040 [Alphaproteobacteria bacterium 41-28]
MILKTQVSLLTLMAAMVSLSLPAWSMEEEGDRESKNIASTSVSSSTLTLMEMPPEIQEHIFSNAAYPGANEDYTTWSALRLTCRASHKIVSSSRFQATSILDLKRRVYELRSNRKTFEAKCLYRETLFKEDSPLSESRFVTLSLASLLKRYRLARLAEKTPRIIDGPPLEKGGPSMWVSEVLVQPLRNKINAAMDSLLQEIKDLPQGPLRHRKDETFLQLYLSLPDVELESDGYAFIPFTFSTETTQLAEERIREAKQAIDDNNWMEKGMPGYLFRSMLESPRLNYGWKDNLQCLNAASDLGDGHASFSLAGYYHYGQEEGVDMARAVLLYKKAAEQGHEKAKRELEDLRADWVID